MNFPRKNLAKKATSQNPQVVFLAQMDMGFAKIDQMAPRGPPGRRSDFRRRFWRPSGSIRAFPHDHEGDETGVREFMGAPAP